MYSAGFDHGTRFVDHGRNMLIALRCVRRGQVRRRSCSNWRCRCNVVGVVLLVVTALPGVGITKKARRAGSTSAW